MKTPILMTAMLLLLSACGTTNTPITGQSSDGSETLTGSVLTDLGAGTSQLSGRLSTGATCQGTAIIRDEIEAKGSITCSDGRSGTFEYLQRGGGGLGMSGVLTGSGKLNGKEFVITGNR